MKKLRDLKQIISIKKVYFAPILINLFLIPIFWNPQFIHSFSQGKEIIFKLSTIIILLILLIVISKKTELKIKNIFQSKLFLITLIIISIFGITNILSKTPIITLNGTYTRGFGFIIQIYLLIFSIYCAFIINKKNTHKLLNIIFVSSLLIAIYGILQKIGINPFFNNYQINIFQGRVFSFLGNPSYLGQFMALTTVFSVYLAVQETNKYKKLLYLIGSIIFITTIFLSGTRTAIIGLIFATILIGIKYFKKIINFSKKHKAIILITIIVGSIAIAYLPKDRFSLSNLAFRSINSRIEIWKGTINLIKKQPILGYGEETFYIYFPEIINKNFLSLEENLNINADRVHNETLEIFFSHGVFALITYIVFFIYLNIVFFTKKNQISTALSLVIITNIVQNQFAFSDISIAIIIAFCIGGLIANELTNIKYSTIKLTTSKKIITTTALLIFILYSLFFTVYRPYLSQLAYAKSQKNYTTSYEISINNHKKAISLTPYYSELWYELMIIDPSSSKRALLNLEKLEGNSGNVLAWKGNFYSKTDPHKASGFYRQALEKNPYHPNWIRAYADMLYEKKDYGNALFLYNQYLNSIPDFWEWTNEIEKRSKKDQKTYETFFKHTPYFWGIIDKIENSIIKINEDLN